MKSESKIVEYTIKNNGTEDVKNLPLLLHLTKKNNSDDNVQLTIEQDDLKFIRSKKLYNYFIEEFTVNYLSFPNQSIKSIPPFEIGYSLVGNSFLEKEIKTYHSGVNYETGEIIYENFNLSNFSCKRMVLEMLTPFLPNEVIKITIKYTKIMEEKKDQGSSESIFTKELSSNETIPNLDEKDLNIETSVIENNAPDFQTTQGVSIPSVESEQPELNPENTPSEPSGLVNVTERNLANTTTEEAKQSTSDLVTFGNGDMWQLLCKVSSQSKRLMKSTKAMQINSVGCVVQVTTIENGVPSESVTFVPNTIVVEDKNEKGEIIGRHLEPSPYAQR